MGWWWQITLDVFRDLGIAFLVAIVIIYMLIVGWFQNFKTPIVMMLRFHIVNGIVFGHWLLGLISQQLLLLG
jgi:multidrug efflux pump subunit AcrB